jgi:hypothetical protein
MTRRPIVTPARLALEALLIALAFFATGAACVVIAALLTPLA